jgi:hypothetical protein
MLYLVGDSKTAKSFVLIDAKSQHYYKSNLETTWKSLDACIYSMTIKNLTKLYTLEEQVEKGLEVLFLPIEPYVTGQAKYLGLEKFRKHYVYRNWEGVPSFIFLDKFLDLWVSQGGCTHDDLQNFLKQSYVKLDSNSFDPYKYKNCKMSKPTQSKVSTQLKDSDTMVEFQRTRQLKKLRNGLKNLSSKRLAQVELKIQKSLEKEDKIKKLEQEKKQLRYQRKSERGLHSVIEHKISELNTYTIRKNRNIETAVFTNTQGKVISVKEFLLSEFGSNYLNLPILTHEVVVGDKVVGGKLTLNVTELTKTKLTDFVYKQQELYTYAFKHLKFSFKELKDSEFKRLLTMFDFRCDFSCLRDDGLFIRLGLAYNISPFVNWDETFKQYYVWDTKVIQNIGELNRKGLYDLISDWFDRHKGIVNSTKYKERQWLNREVIESEVPKNNTNLVYVCYLPESQVIKVGRTENWVSRRGVYTRSSGNTPKTNGKMRLCYFWETFKIGDSVVDKYIMFCAEDHLKRLASSRMTLVEGKEYFEGCDINDFVTLVKEYFSKIELETLLQIRSLSKLKQFAQNEEYDTERLIVKLRQLANL